MSVLTDLELESYLKGLAQKLLQEADNPDSSLLQELANVGNLVNREFPMYLELLQMEVKEQEFKLGKVKARLLQLRPGGSATPLRFNAQEGPSITDLAIQHVAEGMGTVLFELLRGAQVRPVHPRLSLSVTPEQVDTGKTVTAKITLKDLNGEAAPEKSVTLLYWPAGTVASAPPQKIEGKTDAQGAYSTTISVGGQAGVGHFQARYGRGNQSWEEPKNNQMPFVVVEGGVMTVTSTNVNLKGGEKAEVCATIRYQGQGVSGRHVTFNATGGFVFPDTLLTDEAGKACVNFTADASAFPTIAQVGAAYDGAFPGTSEEVHLKGGWRFFIDPGVGNDVNAGASVIAPGEVSDVFADIEVGDLYLAGVPVEFSLEGPGTLSSTAGGTDETGRAKVIYVAPAEGSGTATIYASVTVNGQTVTDSATISYQPKPTGTLTARLRNHSFALAQDRVPEKGCVHGHVVTLGGEEEGPGGCGFNANLMLGPEVSPPYSMTAQTSGALLRWSVTQPAQNSLALEGGIRLTQPNYVTGQNTMDLTFDREGELKIEADPNYWANFSSGAAGITVRLDPPDFGRPPLLNHCTGNCEGQPPNIHATTLPVTPTKPIPLFISFAAGFIVNVPLAESTGRMLTFTFTPKQTP